MREQTFHPALRELDQSLRALVAEAPVARAFVHSLAVWLSEIARSEHATTPQEDLRGVEVKLAAVPPVADTWLAEEQHIAVPIVLEPYGCEETDAQRAAREAKDFESLQKVVDRWGDPEVSPLLDTAVASASQKRGDSMSPSDAALDRLLPRLKRHARAIAWREQCCITTTPKLEQEFFSIKALGKEEQIFFWELDKRVKDFRPSQWKNFRVQYRAVTDALAAHLDASRNTGGSRGAFKTLSHAAKALAAALQSVEQLGLFDRDLGTLVTLCSAHPLHEPENATTRDRNGAKDALKKFDYHLKRVVDWPPGAESESGSMQKALETFIAHGKTISDPQLLKLFDDPRAIHSLPTSLREHTLGAQLVARLTTAAHDAKSRDEECDGEECTPNESTPDIRLVRDALRGKRAVVIGGDERPNRSAAIREAFALGELEWVATKAHERHDNLTAPIRRDDTTIVLLLIRFSSHSYGELKTVCDRHDKLFVRIPGGYSPARLAHEILEQAGERLGITAPSP